MQLVHSLEYAGVVITLPYISGLSCSNESRATETRQVMYMILYVLFVAGIRNVDSNMGAGAGPA